MRTSQGPRELEYDVIYDGLMCRDVTENFGVIIFIVGLFLSYLGALYTVHRINQIVNAHDSESVQSCIMLIPLFKVIHFFLFVCSMLCCLGTTDTAVNLQRYLLMLLVASETVNRTAIACFFYLISHVSQSLSILINFVL